MTYEEALKRVNEMLKKRAFVFSAIYQISFWLRIQEALEKQIPKKPILDILNIIQPMCCPTCESIVKIPQPYCTWCGQAIDWSDNNE